MPGVFLFEEFELREKRETVAVAFVSEELNQTGLGGSLPFSIHPYSGLGLRTERVIGNFFAGLVI